MARVVAFGGISNSGKTTLIKKLITHLKTKYTILAIKHDPKNKAEFDTRGKDSHCFFQAGADVVLASEQKTGIFLHGKQDIQRIFEGFAWKDLIFVEGYKDLPLPRICVVRGQVEEIDLSHVIATDDKNLCQGLGMHLLDLNDIKEIASWIEQHAIEIKDIEWNK